MQGHTDNSGTPEHNKVLSEQRAEAVRAWLVQHGVPSDKLVARGYGQERPIAPNVTAGNRARNRRVQFIILEKEGATAPPPAAPGERKTNPLPGSERSKRAHLCARAVGRMGGGASRQAGSEAPCGLRAARGGARPAQRSARNRQALIGSLRRVKCSPPSLVVFKDAGPQSGARVFFRLFACPSMTSPPAPLLHGIDRDALLRVVEPVVRAHGAEVVDIELKPDRGGWVLRIYVEKAGASANNLSTRDAAVDLELCADVSRDLSPALDVVDLIPHAYQPRGELARASSGRCAASATSPASPGRRRS